MRRHSKARYLAPAAVALVMIVSGALTSVRNTRAMLVEAQGIERSHELLQDLERCLIAMLNLETGQRGYLITGREEFLEPYRAAFEEVDRCLADIAARLDGTERLREVVAAKRRELADGVRLYQDGGAAPDMAAGKRRMDEVRAVLGGLVADEEARLAIRQKRMVQQFRDTRTVVVTTAAVALAAGLTGVWLLGLYLRAKDREAALELEKEKAERADEAKADFLAVVSHEIRTPMNAILGFGELLRDSVEKPRDRHFANAIVTSGRSLLTLINDILDLSKMDAGKLALHPETVEMKAFAENLETLFAYRAQEKGLDFSIRLDRSVPALLCLDAVRLRQVLVNLIGNALKFTASGRVAVTMRCAGEGEDLQLSVEVEDTGIGIAPEKLRDIFRPFYQVEPQHARHYQGTGLGLNICERLVQLMGGDIGARSEAGSGTVFHLRLPVRRADGAAPADGGAAEGGTDFNRLAPARILIVDALATDRERIRAFLAGTHHEVLEAESGEQAVMQALRARPQVVLVDAREAAAGPHGAIALLKARPETRAIPRIAMTARSDGGLPESWKRDFDGSAAKPVSRERLFLELARFLPVHAAAATARPQPAEPVWIRPADRAWPELRGDLESLREGRLPALLKLVPAQATADFAAELARLAARRGCTPLDDYARRLATAAGTLDVAEAGRLLEAFPAVIELLAADA